MRGSLLHFSGALWKTCPAAPSCILALVCASFASAAALAADKQDAPRQPQGIAPEVATHLQEALEEGFGSGPKHLHEAQKHLDKARKGAPRDPRVEYAAAIIFLKQSQTKAAVSRFEAALKLDKTGYWPAWQGAIWGHLAEKQLEMGLKQLDEFALLVEGAEAPDEISEAQRDAARWVGQVYEAAVATAESKKTRDQAAGHEQHLLETFGDELAEAFEDGREALRDRLFELEQEEGMNRAAAGRNAERRKQDKAAKLEKEIEGLGKAKETAARTADEWKKWLEDVQAKADKQLGLLERDYNFLNQRLASLMQSITLLGQQMTALELQANTQQNGTAPIYAQNAQFLLMQWQNQMLGYQLDYNATLGRMSEIARLGALLAEQKAEAVKRYETETGQLVKKEVDLDKWSGRLKNQKQKLTVQKPAGKGSKKAAHKKPQLSLKALLPFDAERERDQLIATWAPAPALEDDKAE